MKITCGGRRCIVLSVVILLMIVVPLWFTIDYAIIELLQKNEMADILQRAQMIRERGRSKMAAMAEPRESMVVPNVVHYIWYGEKEFKLHHFLSLLSVKRFIKPDKILLHTDKDRISEHLGPFSYQYWDQAKELTEFEIVESDPPSEVFGKTITHPRDQAILARITTLLKYGGIYLDSDVIVIKNFDFLRRYDFVIGRENMGLNPGIMLARENDEFLQKWWGTFENYNETTGVNLMTLAQLCKTHSKLVYIENKKFRRRDQIDGDETSENIFFGHVNHRHNLAIKLYYEYFNKEYSEYEIQYLNTTFGELARNAYFGSPKLRIMDWPSKPNATRTLIVPNIVHYVWFTKEEFKFHNFLSVKSAITVQNAESIIFHCDPEPNGKWWEITKEMAETRGKTILRVVHREQPKEIFGNAIEDIHHRSDIARIQVLLEYGGIYLNPDAIVVNNLNPLRSEQCTMGLDIYGLNNGVVLAAPNSKFMKLYHDTYEFYDGSQMYLNSREMPYEIASENIDLIHIEGICLTRPEWTDWWDMGKLWKNGCRRDWSHMHVIQLGYGYHNNEYDAESIKTLDNTFGEIARYIYYGSTEKIK
ncbi:uncharacterized protein LOC144342836 [Saccoglossus kowalevskii]